MHVLMVVVTHQSGGWSENATEAGATVGLHEIATQGKELNHGRRRKELGSRLPLV